MRRTLGIRREDKNQWERRVPLTPENVKELVTQGFKVFVQPSTIRVFSDSEYVQAGAEVREDLDDCPLVLGVKEMPIPFLKEKRAYVYFSHVIKGQSYNMTMLKKLLDNKCTLVDYEKITDDKGRRLIFFGRYAGCAGMIDTLWALGKNLEQQGMDTPFSQIKMTYEYGLLENAKKSLKNVSDIIQKEGLPSTLTPMVFGFTGYGNVSQGAQEVFDLLPHREISPAELIGGTFNDKQNTLFKVVFKEEHLVRHKNAEPFHLQQYYDEPDKYESDFEKYLPYISVLMNCIYWADKYPKLVTLDYLKKHWKAQDNSLRVIGDITCDIRGSIECNFKSTVLEDPVYVYCIDKDDIVSGVQGNGPVVMAVDNLPCELPQEASRDFGKALMPFLPEMIEADYSQPIDKLQLPAPIERAVITHQGSPAPDFRYLSGFLKDL